MKWNHAFFVFSYSIEIYTKIIHCLDVRHIILFHQIASNDIRAVIKAGCKCWQRIHLATYKTTGKLILGFFGRVRSVGAQHGGGDFLKGTSSGVVRIIHIISCEDQIEFLTGRQHQIIRIVGQKVDFNRCIDVLERHLVQFLVNQFGIRCSIRWQIHTKFNFLGSIDPCSS
ncbi:hypothetical protein D3C73_635920 [compost metagenome]